VEPANTAAMIAVTIRMPFIGAPPVIRPAAGLPGRAGQAQVAPGGPAVKP
jgi:hypothetical protein